MATEKIGTNYPCQNCEKPAKDYPNQTIPLDTGSLSGPVIVSTFPLVTPIMTSPVGSA